MYSLMHCVLPNGTTLENRIKAPPDVLPDVLPDALPDAPPP